MCQELGAERKRGFPVMSPWEKGQLLPSSPQGSFPAGQSLAGDPGHGWGGRGHWSSLSWTKGSSHHGQQHADPLSWGGSENGPGHPHRGWAAPAPAHCRPKARGACRRFRSHRSTPRPTVRAQQTMSAYTQMAVSLAPCRSRLFGQVSCTLHRVQRVK